MKKLVLLLLILCSTTSLVAQDIQQIQAYTKLEGSTRIIALLSDQSGWFYTLENGWRTLPVDEFPDGEVKFLDVYQKGFNTRLMTVLEDNSIWWSKEDSWEKITSKGLPENYKINDFKPYSKIGLYGMTKTRVVTLLEDNSLWWYANDNDWQQVKTTGLPKEEKIEFIRTYQKYSMMGSSDTRYVVLMSDNSIWWFSAKAKKWKEFSGDDLPNDKPIRLLEVYSKSNQMTMPEGRLIAVLSDESIWWGSAKNEYWEQVNTDDLPENYKIKSIKVYQKMSSIKASTRLLVLLEDNSIWWYVNGEGFSPVDMSTLNK